MVINMAICVSGYCVTPGWSHQNPGFSSGGAISIKGQSNGNISAQRNPNGAIAKTNQSAVTQSPTVVIQATNGGYSDAVPIMSSTGTAPSCPAGYSSAFSVESGPSAAACPSAMFNIAGTRFSLLPATNGGYMTVGFYVDNMPSPLGGSSSNSSVSFSTQFCGYNWPASTWSARLCVK